jgi:hypothetical protein
MGLCCCFDTMGESIGYLCDEPGPLFDQSLIDFKYMSRDIVGAGCDGEEGGVDVSERYDGMIRL